MSRSQQKLAQAHAYQQAGQLEEAFDLCGQVLREDHGHPDALHLSGLIELERRNHEQAILQLKRAAGRQPGNQLILSNLGGALLSAGRLSEALEVCQRSLRNDPASAPAYINRGQALVLMGAADEGLGSLRTAETFEPSPELAGSILYVMNFLPGVSPADLVEEHRRWGKRFGESTEARWVSHTNEPAPDRRLRIGYLSADLYNHPVASFVEPLLRAHDRSQVSVFVYASVAAPDATTERLRPLADEWIPVQGLADEALASRILEDRIDILVELGGHTDRSRLTALMHRPAPIQVSWLGYPNTTGLPAMDARISDAHADPEGADAHYTEKLLRLDRSFLCYSPPADSPEIEVPTGETITFGSFNNLAKLNSKVVELWARVLKKIPGSRLLLKAAPLQDEGVRARITGLFQAQGVAPERLELLGRVVGQANHLAHYNRIDIALDPFPYNGTTTTCEALWMGVPVLALQGNRHASRVTSSLLSAIGHPEWIASSPKEYVKIAEMLAKDRGRLASIRKNLRAEVSASPLMDASGFARSMERAYRDLWREWCARNEPQDEG